MCCCQLLLSAVALTSVSAIYRRPVRVAVLRGPPLSPGPPPHHVHRGHPVVHHYHPARRPQFALRPKAPPPRIPTLLWDQGSFRAPAHKEGFNPQPASADDDKGPIHTIPAPNLSLGKPHEPPPSLSPGKQYEPSPGLNLVKPYEPPPGLNLGKPYDLPLGINIGKPYDQTQGLNLGKPYDHTLGLNLGKPYDQTLGLNLGKPYDQTLGLNVGKPYEVHEPTNDQTGYNVQGVVTYYAPDPDPSLPAAKIPAALDPHDVPSDTKQLGALTSQDLLQLLGGVPDYQQVPQDFQPQFQTFNYEEQYRGPDARDDFGSSAEQSVEDSPGEEAEAETFYTKVAGGVASSAFYTTLPSKEVAERLASLRASGQAASQERESDDDVVLEDKDPDYDDGDVDVDAQFGAKIRPKRSVP